VAPLPGEYRVLRYQAPVAVCTLNSSDLASKLREQSPQGLSIVGTMHTENLGIERLIRNVNANPNLRFLIVCGEDTQQRIGHLPGQSLASLFANGLDARSRIIGARGKRPVLKNVTAKEVSAFRKNVELVDMTGEDRTLSIVEEIGRCTGRDPGVAPGMSPQQPIAPAFVNEPVALLLDPAGYFVVYPETRRRTLVLEHYSNNGVLDAVLEGRSAGVLYQAAISRNLISRLASAITQNRPMVIT
jgi:tetrahydromethanopterin S-methyltransferase subunit A